VFGRCGGCVLQHVTADEQRVLKAQSLADSLERIGRVEPGEWLEPLTAGDGWHYRRRARLAVKNVPGKGRVLVGFRERHAPFITDMHRCDVLCQPVDTLIDPLSEMISGLSIAARLPQIEVAVADNATELVFRVLDAPTDADLDVLREFGNANGLRISLQPKGPDSVSNLVPGGDPEPLVYRLPDFDVEIAFEATDFVQVNGEINRRMVSRAIELLDVEPAHHVLDLFCGIGNFTLPLARRAANVTGIEGEQRQVARASANAARNGIDNARFQCADLAQIDGAERWVSEGCDRLLLDPARSGADGVVRHIDRLAPERIVYVSCHPGTLARDAGMLVNDSGYRLEAAGIIDMFPHTAHVESIAVFQRAR
jgi:23S rRNA (uracil1939-C5)-methyltransferase